MVSSKADCSIPPGSDDEIVMQRALVVVFERIRLIRASNSTPLFFTVHVESLCRKYTVTKYTEDTNG